MSMRHFRPRNRSRRGITPVQGYLLFGLLALELGLQVSYPLVAGSALRVITIATVYVGAALVMVHSIYSYGNRYAYSMFALVFLYSWAVEELGSRSGWPFGHYTYSHSLGVAILGVPLVVPFAWIMMVHPALIVARRLAPHWVFLYGGAILMAWDLFLDPQMVSDQRWVWKFTGAAVPFEHQIPLSNAVGWLLAGMGIIAILNLVLPKERKRVGANSLAMDVLLGWTLFAGLVGNLFYFHRPGVAFLGTIILGGLLAPYFFVLSFGRPDQL
jgi:putative membrane protein